MIGDPDLPVRGMYSEEGFTQKNWPHINELFAAAEAGKFFNAPPIEGNAANKWYGNPFKLNDAGDKRTPYNIELMEWSDYDNHVGLKDAIDNYLLFNFYYSMYIVPHLFDYPSNKLELWNVKADDDIAEERKDEMPDWVVGRFIKMGGLVFKKPERFYHEVAVSRFSLLFKYLTQSAQWFYQIANDFGNVGEKTRPCWESNERKECSGSVDCLRARTPLLPKLFHGREGMRILGERACMPRRALHTYIKQSTAIAKAFGKVEGNFDFDEKLNGKANGGDGKENQARMFTELIAEVYNVISPRR